MKGILGKKVGMTQVFDESGEVIPVTVIEAGPCFVTQKKTVKQDGYTAIQLGFEEVKPKRLTQPQRGHLRKNNLPPLRYLREIRMSEGEIEEYAEFMDEIPPRPRAGKWAAQRYQRRHDVHVLWHVKKAVELLERFFVAKACDWLVIGGTTEPLAQLRAQLPQALQDRIAGEISVSLSADADEVLAQLLEIEQETERRVEAERVEELITATCKGGPAVLAMEDTLMGLTEGRVMALIVEAGYTAPGFECRNCHFLTTVEHPSCPVCGASMEPVGDVVEGAVERALDQQAQIEVVRGEARARLAEHGHIGALLRY